MIDELVAQKLLKEFKPIIVIYFPIHISLKQVSEVRDKFLKQLENKYYMLVIPHSEDDFKIELLSILKEKYIKDSDLKRYLEQIQNDFLKK
jgi:hypothetical protein